MSGAFAAVPSLRVRPACLFGQFQRWWRLGVSTSWGAGGEPTERGEAKDNSDPPAPLGWKAAPGMKREVFSSPRSAALEILRPGPSGRMSLN